MKTKRLLVFMIYFLFYSFRSINRQFQAQQTRQKNELSCKDTNIYDSGAFELNNKH